MTFKARYNTNTPFETLLKDETIFHVANGFLGMKHHFIEGYGTDQKRTLVLGGFYNTYPYHYEENSAQFPQVGQTIMPWPDATLTTFELNGTLMDLTNMRMLYTNVSFELDQGYVQRETMYEFKGHKYLLNERRLASLHHVDHVHLQVSFKSLDEHVSLKLVSWIQMPYIKPTLIRDPRVAYEREHIEFVDASLRGLETHYDFQTKDRQHQGKIIKMMSIPTVTTIEGNVVLSKYDIELEKEEAFEFHLQLIVQGSHVEPTSKQFSLLDFDEVLSIQKRNIEKFWSTQTLYLNDPHMDISLKYSVYQLYMSGAFDHQVSIAAKGLSGEGYEGHYFWDTEVYMFPYFLMHHEQKAKNMLMYRYHHLEASRHESKQMGILKGAKIPWRTINGFEASPYFPSGSAQLHINSDIAFAVIQYVHKTKQIDFLIRYGFEMLFETARYILNYGHFKDGQFHLQHVTGPDEYTVLVNNNYYTNRMVQYHFEHVLKWYDMYRNDLKEVVLKLSIEEEEITRLKQAAKNIVLLFDDQLNIWLQDQEHHLRKPLPKGILPNQGLPIFLKYHPQFVYRHQVLKQADVIAAQVLLNQYDDRFQSSFHYYLPMTSHDSSLSKCMYGIGAYHIDEDELAFNYFKEVLLLDIDDTKGHTKNGLHLANMGGAYLMVMKGLFGIYLDETLSINPVKQSQFNEVHYGFHYQGTNITLTLKKTHFNIKVSEPIVLTIYNQEVHIIDHYEYVWSPS
jgi:alpha,alpha-trehalose phosphorylase